MLLFVVVEIELLMVEVWYDDIIIFLILGVVNRKDWFYFCLVVFLMFFMIYKVKGENIDYFIFNGLYDGYIFYSVGYDKIYLMDIVEVYFEMSNEIYK